MLLDKKARQIANITKESAARIQKTLDKVKISNGFPIQLNISQIEKQEE